MEPGCDFQAAIGDISVEGVTTMWFTVQASDWKASCLGFPVGCTTEWAHITVV